MFGLMVYKIKIPPTEIFYFATSPSELKTGNILFSEYLGNHEYRRVFNLEIEFK